MLRRKIFEGLREKKILWIFKPHLNKLLLIKEPQSDSDGRPEMFSCDGG